MIGVDMGSRAEYSAGGGTAASAAAAAGGRRPGEEKGEKVGPWCAG